MEVPACMRYLPTECPVRFDMGLKPRFRMAFSMMLPILLRRCYFRLDTFHRCFESALLSCISHTPVERVETCCECSVGHVTVDLNPQIHFCHGFFRNLCFVVPAGMCSGRLPRLWRRCREKLVFHLSLVLKIFCFLAYLDYWHVFADKKFHFFSRFTENLA